MNLRSIIRNSIPEFALNWLRKSRKIKRNKALIKSKETGLVWTKESLLLQLQSAGIQIGDSVLVHASLSKIGYVENGPSTVVKSLLEAVGDTGNLLMPTSPNAGLQLDFVRSNPVFDVAHTPSKMGAISEHFRTLPNVVLSAHPTEPVSCWGIDSEHFTSGHFNEKTPYSAQSPFYRLVEKGGKILYIGVTLDNAGTSLHVLEDAIPDFKFPVYFSDLFELNVILPNGETKTVQTVVHDPMWSSKRKCDALFPLFIQSKAAKEVAFGNAKMWVFDARLMFEVMKKAYLDSGITMYTPNGSSDSIN